MSIIRFAGITLLLVLAAAVGAQGPLNETIEFSDVTLELVEFARIPLRPISGMATQPTADDRLFVVSISGSIFAVEEVPGGANRISTWFDVRETVPRITGRNLNYANASHGGLRSVAFHPEFATNGKFYTSLVEDRPDNLAEHHYLGNSVSNVMADSVLVEWTYDHAARQVIPDSYRELFRVSMPVFDHPIKQIKFNPFSRPGDEDYGLLYVDHGDASTQAATSGGGQNRADALGKVLRIDPLATDTAPYTTPHNPFLEDELTLDEIYALGFRNPHNLSFARDGEGNSRLIVADIGRDNIEEIDIVEPGGNYGWSEREGTLVHLSRGGINRGVAPLPENEAELGFVYPVAQFDHGDGSGTIAVAGGHVIANGSELDGQYFFGDFASSGAIYHASFADMLSAVTILDPADPARDEPGELTQAQVSRARLALDDDHDPSTPAKTFDRFTDLLGASRSDIRFGEGKQGELYISSKVNGKIYLVTNSLPPVTFGDFNQDGTLDAADIDLILGGIHRGSQEILFDINNDGQVNDRDGQSYITDIMGTLFGDANLDRRVNFADFLLLSDRFGGAGGWSVGDFDGSQEIDFADFLILSGNYGESAGTSALNVPEPDGWMLLQLCGPILLLTARRRSDGV